ncbi:DUF5123 domain-containing protein [Pseudopedobacter sp.]|uniref:DUF5123 domain-containing protein n=1 Tax=Pseudopedobacter sp. TaxID=1936787 RepID=UPI003342D08E
MKKIFLRLTLLASVSIIATSCIKKANEWDIDPSHDRLFKSLVFEVVKTEATTVELKYTKAVSANKYIFEFSKDNLEFNEIVKTVEILADTLTPFNESTTPTKVEYRTIFEELDGTTGYSVRMKSVDTLSGTESKYSQVYFETAAEQLFTSWDVFTDKINISWTPTDRVTHITVFDAATGEEVQKNTLTPVEIGAGNMELINLSPGTNYKIIIYNNEVERGTKILKTSGLQGGIIINVNPGDDIPALVSTAVSQGKPNVTLMFKGGETYDLGTLILPAGLSNVSFTGENDISGTAGLPALLNLKEVRLSDAIFGKLIFEKVVLTGGTGDYLINLATDGVEIEEYNFSNCFIFNYRGTVRVQNKNIKLKKISFDNNRFQNTGDYGIVNIGGSTPVVDSISFKNSTMQNMASQLMDVRSKVKGIIITNCTIYNQTKALTQLVRLDKNNLPSTFEAFNNIISGSNNGTQLKAFSLTYDGSFAGSYRTNEMSIGQEFPNITVFQGSAEDLFVDPANGNFRVKSESGFGGRGTAGDPRWF